MTPSETLMQYRVSRDGIVWSSWRAFTLLLDERDGCYVQGRVWLHGAWRVTPIKTWFSEVGW